MSALYIGLMSGTSLDGIDAVLVDLSPPIPQVLAASTLPFDINLRDDLHRLASGHTPNEVDLLGHLDCALGEAFAAAAIQLLDSSGTAPARVTAIGSHGQTIRHRPGGTHPFTLQIGNPNIIVERTGITTVADFRRRDMAAGGQGAPLVPAFHASCFRTSDESRCILNIGGMANITHLPAAPDAPVTGFDTGPGNVLMDAWINANQGELLDRDGHWAAQGRILHDMLEALLRDEYVRQAPPKSTGREYFCLDWLKQQVDLEHFAPADIQATLNALTARSIADAVTQWAPDCQRLLVCGGGVHNRTLLKNLSENLPALKIESTEIHGLHPDWVEATAFAWLAQQTLSGRTGSIASVTGARHDTVLGGIFPAAGVSLALR